MMRSAAGWGRDQDTGVDGLYVRERVGWAGVEGM